MRISDKFIFVHIPKTGGTWMREALTRVYLNQFFNGSITGLILSRSKKFISAKYLEQKISPLIFFEYSHHKPSELPTNLLARPPYKRRFFISAIIDFLQWIGLWKNPASLGLFLTHTRVSQLPKHLVTDDVNILTPLSNPLRWHISRYNYYRKRLASNKHAADICRMVGEFTDFNLYLDKQMMQMLSIYYRSYITYVEKNTNNSIDDFKYPTDVMSWFDKASQDLHTPKHYGLLSWFFIWFLLPNPREILCLSPKDYDDYISSNEFTKQINRFNFLSTQNLNQETYKFLLHNGYQKQDLTFIKNMPPINTSTEQDKYSLYYNNKQQLEKLYQLEKIIFYAMPEYRKDYKLELLI